MRKSRLAIGAGIASLALAVGGTIASAQADESSPTISIDVPEGGFSDGQSVQVTGHGFSPNELVSLEESSQESRSTDDFGVVDTHANDSGEISVSLTVHKAYTTAGSKSVDCSVASCGISARYWGGTSGTGLQTDMVPIRFQ